MDVKKDILEPASVAVQNYIPGLLLVIDPFLKANPFWAIAIYSAIGLYGVYMYYNQKEINEVIEFIENHPEEFREEIVKSEEFRKGFLIFIENYLKQRLLKKKEILKKIILGFTTSTDKKNFELERLDDCLMRISISSLEFLIFWKTEILPEIENEISSELERDYYQKSDRSFEWWYEKLIILKSMWLPVDQWINNNFNPQQEKIKKEYGIENAGWPPDLLHKAETVEREKRTEISECLSELVSLSIIKSKPAAITFGGGGGNDYSLTIFGKNFLDFI